MDEANFHPKLAQMSTLADFMLLLEAAADPVADVPLLPPEEDATAFEMRGLLEAAPTATVIAACTCSQFTCNS